MDSTGLLDVPAGSYAVQVQKRQWLNSEYSGVSWERVTRRLKDVVGG
jgi:hypothetical protein